MRILLLVIIVSILFTSSVSAIANDCEKLAKDYQEEHGGYLIFIQPLKDNGAYDLGAFNGHWLNKAYNKDMGVYYYDSQTDTYLKTEQNVLNWYKMMSEKKAELFNVNKGGVPFAIRYHY